MSEMSERVADVLLNWGCGTSDECEKIARAAIAAMREPTDGQRIAYFDECRKFRSLAASVMEDAEWERMIDAALR